jgi:NAD(P)-dependent dehydrogenase (short-subunit alcohol dehydrogenase family)
MVTPPTSHHRCIVLTGASTGIGAACAIHLDRLGFRVFAGVRRLSDGDALTAQTSSRLTPILLEVTDAGSIAAAAGAVRTAVGTVGLAGLVNNAGIGVTGPLELVPLTDFRYQFEVNVIGLLAVTQAFLPLLRQGRGRIVNMGSIAGRASMPFMGPYSASKHALAGLTDALRLELQPQGIQVSLIEPGAIATPIWSKTRKVADQWNAGWSPEANALYAEGFGRVKDAAAKAEAGAQPVSLVAHAVEHALCAPRPKTRYLIGFDAKLRACTAAVLPDRIQDWLLTRILKLPPRA